MVLMIAVIMNSKILYLISFHFYKHNSIPSLLGAAFKLPKTHSPNLCIPFLPPLVSNPLLLQVVILCAFQNKPLACHPPFYH